MSGTHAMRKPLCFTLSVKPFPWSSSPFIHLFFPIYLLRKLGQVPWLSWWLSECKSSSGHFESQEYSFQPLKCSVLAKVKLETPFKCWASPLLQLGATAILEVFIQWDSPVSQQGVVPPLSPPPGLKWEEGDGWGATAVIALPSPSRSVQGTLSFHLQVPWVYTWGGLSLATGAHSLCIQIRPELLRNSCSEDHPSTHDWQELMETQLPWSW